MQGAGRRLVVLFAVVPHPNVPNGDPGTPASANPGSAPRHASAFDQLIWPAGVPRSDRTITPPSVAAAPARMEPTGAGRDI
jgi:hypothetical protein